MLHPAEALNLQSANALLKTLEEPPPHVKFLFATTEIRKVPVTVLSRCQRFDLRRIEIPAMVAYLDAIVAHAGERIASLMGFATEAEAAGLAVNRDGIRRSAYQILSYPDIGFERLATVWPELGDFAPGVIARVTADAAREIPSD